MTETNIVVVGHIDRLGHVLNLKTTLGAKVFLDDGTLGEWGNHERALRWASTKPGHVLVLQDDAQPVDGMVNVLPKIATRVSDDPVSLYLGTGRPAAWQPRIREATSLADEHDAGLIRSVQMLHGVAILYPTRLLTAYLDWARSSTEPYDYRLGAWCRLTGHHCYYTWPSLVDHEDGPSLVNHPDGEQRTEIRKAWRVGVPHFGGLVIDM